MAAGKGQNKSFKTNPELFSDETLTPSERILAELEQQKTPEIIEDLADIEKALDNRLADLPQAEIATAKERISDLLDKYYNGDPDVDFNQRFAHKKDYKNEIIQTLKCYNITYVEKPHYPLSKDEKHIIRMDFFGRINRPHFTNLSPLYQGYLRFKGQVPDEEASVELSPKKKKRNSKFKNPTPLNTRATIYPLESYDLSISPSWQLFHLFPRFHNLERRMLKTIQSLHIPPEQLNLLSVYDFSDILYRTFRKSEKSPDAHLFLGARHAFIKDVFKKHEQWIRAYLQRQHIHPRYINSLIKMAQSKGVTNDINITTDANTYMSEFAMANAEDFQTFIISSIRSDNYADEIRTRIQRNAFVIKGPALHFLQSNQNHFKQFIKKHLLEQQYVSSLYDQFNPKIPGYVIKDINNFINANQDDFITYLTKHNLQGIIRKKSNKKKQWNIAKAFIQKNQDSFYEYLIDQGNSANYANFALHALDGTPQLTDFGKDTIISFILHNDKLLQSLSPKTQQHIQNKELDKQTLQEISPLIRLNFSNLQEFFTQTNILTYNELQNELIDNERTIIFDNSLPGVITLQEKGFILSHASLFKDWYLTTNTDRYKENASSTFDTIVQQGLNEQNLPICKEFIRERLSNFMEYAIAKGISSSEIIHTFRDIEHPVSSELTGTIQDFITRYGSTFKNFLLQKHIEKNESLLDSTLKKIKQNDFYSGDTAEILHKFILDNQSSYIEYKRKNKQIQQQANVIYEHIINNNSETEEKTILSKYLNENIYNYMIFQQDDEQLLPYSKNILHNIKQLQIDSTEEHWLKAYTQNHAEQFSQYMISQNYLDEDKEDSFISSIQQQKQKLVVSFKDGYVMKIDFGVHHKRAAQDSGEIKHHKNIIPEQNEICTNIAKINDFSNLCVFTEFWHRVMHSMDSTEPYNNRERFVARLMPTDPNIIFYGSENEEDQLSYDYANDKRTKRYDRHLSDLAASQSER